MPQRFRLGAERVRRGLPSARRGDGGIRQACIAKWGKVPLLETYRQMAIRQQKAHNYRQALWWADVAMTCTATTAPGPKPSRVSAVELS